MNPLDVLSPEIVDLCTAIGLVHATGDGPAFDSDWFGDPGPRVARALADDGRRAALVRFVEAVRRGGQSGGGREGDGAGVTLLTVFDAGELGGPPLRLSVALDDRPTEYVEVGLAVSYATTTPATTIELVVPLYRTGKADGVTVRPVSEPFALAAGAPIRLTAAIDLGAVPPDASGFALGSVTATVGVAVTGTVGPTIDIALGGLRLPGSTAPIDLRLGGPDASVDDALLSLVLGVVRAGAASLGADGPAVLAALDLVGLGDDPAIPPLSMEAIAAQGVGALRAWFATTMADATVRDAWLGALHGVVGGTLGTGELRVALGGGPVVLVVGVASVPGPDGHLRVTPHVGLELSTVVGAGPGAVRIGARASIDIVTVDLFDGTLTPLPDAELLVELTGDGARLLATGPVQIGTVELGVARHADGVAPVLRLLDVVAGGATHEVVDLSSADAVMAAAGEVAGDLARTALDAFAAGAHLKALLGLEPAGPLDALDAGRLFVDPLGELRRWWTALVTTNAAEVPAVLGHLRDLVAHDEKVALPSVPASVAAPISGSGTEADPWQVPLVGRVALDVWVAASTLVVAVDLGFRIDDLAGGCTVVTTSARAELVAIDLVAGHARLLSGVAWRTDLRGRGQPDTRLSLGPVVIVADAIALTARWTATTGFAVALEAPGLAAEVDGTRVPLTLPTAATWRTAALVDIEHLVGVVGASNPHGWLNDVVGLLGWRLGDDEPAAHRLALDDLVATPGPALQAWALAVITDQGLLDRAAQALARVLTGSSHGIEGAFTGRGTPSDPWLLPLGRGDAAPALAIALGPDGPRLAPSMTSNALRTWRPGLAGLPAAGLARAVVDEGAAADDVAALGRGRTALAEGLADLGARVVATDVLVAAPPTTPIGVTVVAHPAVAFDAWATLDVATALAADPPAGAAVVRVAIGAPTDHPWPSAPPGRVVDLSAPALAPESFTVASPAAGEWFVVLGRRADTSLGTTDPSGVLGQAARLARIVAALGAGREVVLVAIGGAGHAARLVADGQPAVTHLVTLGAPWSAVAFDTARLGVSGDALRLLAALLPAPDPTEPDDADLALGRAIVQGLLDTRRQFDLEAPRPTVAVRAGLAVRAWFGALDQATVDRAFTAVVAAGLAGRARQRAERALAPAADVRASLRIPVGGGVPASGHGIVVRGHLELGLSAASFAAPALAAAPGVRVHLELADTDAWLVGGPGTTPAEGAAPLEVRRLEVDVDVRLDGTTSTASLTLHEVAALGAYRDRIVVARNGVVSGTTEDLPFLPEGRAALGAVLSRVRAQSGGATGALTALLDGLGLTTATGLVPDALTALLHEPGPFVATRLATVEGRTTVSQALAALIGGATRTGDVVTFTVGPVMATVDLAARRASVEAASTVGALPWTLSLTGLGGATSGALVVGAPLVNGGAVRLELAPLRVSLVDVAADGSARSARLWPDPDLDGVVGYAEAALPAEAVRLVLGAVRALDAPVGLAIDSLAAALGVLGPADGGGGRRPILAPVALFDDPGAWFRRHVLAGGGGLIVAGAVDLLEALKPFLRLTGTPRGHWPVVAGVDLTVTAGATGPTIGITVDPTVWLGNAERVPFAAGVTLALTVPATGAPSAALEVFVGLAEATPSGLHRRAVHVSLADGVVTAFLRPTAGADIALFPGAAGLGALLESATVDLLLPKVLDELAALDGSPVRRQVAALVSALGLGLDVVTLPAASPVRFDGAKLHELADRPGPRLADRAVALVAQIVPALHPLLQQLPGAPSAVMDGSDLVLTVRTVTVRVQPDPLQISVSGTVTGLPIIGAAGGSFVADASGLAGWSVSVGPARFDLDGPVLRPFVRAERAWSAGWEVDLGLALDDAAVADVGHQELFARWQESAGLAVVARSHTGAGDDDRTDAGTIALFAADAVLELLGNHIVALGDVALLLDRTVGGASVRSLLQGSILSDTDDHRLRPAPIGHLPGSLFVLARKLAGALPAVSLGGIFTVALVDQAGVLGVRLDVSDPNRGLELNPGADVVLSLVTDASWIEPPSGTPPPAGIVIDIVHVNADAVPVVTPHPGIAVNGVGVRIAKSAGPLLDAGLRLDAVAVHLFGSLEPGSGSGGAAVSGGINLALEGLAVPLGAGGGDNAVAQGVMSDAGGSGAPPTPKFSPAVAVQAHDGVDGVAVSLRAGSGDGPWYLPIQRAFGPVYLEQVGLGTGYTGTSPRQLDWVSVSLDGSVSLFGITASVDKLRLTYHVNQPFFSASSWAVDLDGFAIASDIGGLTLVGALVRSPLTGGLKGVEYLGMLKIGFSGYGVDLFGGYANPTDGNGSFASFFAFGALHAPIGGPPAFFITGIGLGLGINRALEPPSMDTITSDPFLVAMKALGPAPDPKVQLEAMRTKFTPQRDEYWVAAGISFTSFVLISGEVVVTVAFGDGLDITVLGLARAELPAPALTLVSIELALLARFSTKEGVLLVQAQLTENSWLLSPSIRLTGGFAFATWWKGPNAGQFVVTMGGYHPKFHHPGYPTVPRLGFRWQPIDNVSIVGESYFALCSEALMAGSSFEASAHFGPAHARLSFGVDGIVFFDPFWFSVSAFADISAGIRIWLLFGTVDIEISLGAFVEVSGPPIHVTGHFEICGFEVPFEFGDTGNPEDNALNAGAFRDKYLRASSDAQVIQASVGRGAVTAGRKTDGGPQKVPDGSPTNPFLVIPEFELVLISTAPAIDMALEHTGAATVSLRVDAPAVGVAPMLSHTLTSRLHADLERLGTDSVFDLDGLHLRARPAGAFPKGVWGEAQDMKTPKVPAGETVPASDGFTVSAVLDESIFTGAPAIDYHQVELPFGGRKPLPFVTNRARTDARLAAAQQLRTMADAVRPAAHDLDARFNVAARVLDAGGYGALGVASLRGERASAPTFGSLADDLAPTPDAVSSAVDTVAVDRTPPGRPFVGPMVKAVLGSPFTLATDAAAVTTVRDRAAALVAPVPSLATMRAQVARFAPASLVVQSRAAAIAGKSVLPTGAAAVTRLATAPSAAIANARPDPAAAARLRAMTAGLGDASSSLREGELAIVTVASRPTGPLDDQLVVGGGAVRVIALASGGNVLFDDVVGGDGNDTTVTVPRKTERVVVAALGPQANVGGPLHGWYSGQSVPLIGWDIAMAAGALVTFANHKATDNRERRDGGWASTRDLTAAARVVTRFDAPVTAVAVAVDDPARAAGPDAASTVAIALTGAVRAVGPDGIVLAPVVLVQGPRTMLLYAVVPQPDPTALDPSVLVVVDGTRAGHLAGVAGLLGTVDDLARALATSGFDAAVAAALPGGSGRRRFGWHGGDPAGPGGPVGAPVAPKKKTKKTAPAKQTRKRG